MNVSSLRQYRLSPNTITQIQRLLAIIITLIAMIIYSVVSYKYATNIPFWDDYRQVLDFLPRYQQTEGVLAKLKLIFALHNEHRIALHRILAIIDYNIFGSVNLDHIIILGNTGIFAIWFLLWKITKTSLYRFLPITLLMFVAVAELSNWAGTSFMYNYVLFFAFLSLYFLQQKNKLVVAIIFAILATFALGNGLFTFFAGFIILLLERPFSKRRTLIWTVTTLIMMIVYFWGYQSAENNPSIFTNLLNYPINVAAYPVVFFGAIFKSIYTNHHYLAPIFGLLVLLYTVLIVFYKWKFFQEKPLLLSFIFFILITVAAASVTRAGFGLGAATARRYQLMPILFICVLYISSLKIFKPRVLPYLPTIIGFCLLFFILRTDDQIRLLKEHDIRLVRSMQYFQGGNANYLAYSNSKVAAQMLSKSIETGVYQVPVSTLQSANQASAIPLTKTTDNIRYSIEQLANEDKLITIKGWAYIIGEATTFSNTFIVLKNIATQQTEMFATQSLLRSDITIMEDSNLLLDQAGYLVILNKDYLKLPSGEYQIGIYMEKLGTTKAWVQTDQTIKL